MDTSLTDWLVLAYDQLRTARLNLKYYGRRLVFVRRVMLAMNIAIALGTSAVVASWAIWDVQPAVWASFASFAAVLSLARPFLQLEEKVESYATLFSSYRTIDLELQAAIHGVRQSRQVNRSARSRLEEAIMRQAALTDEDAHPSRRALRKAEDEVNEELPPESLWMPTAA